MMRSMIAYGAPGPRALDQDDAILRLEAALPEIGPADLLLQVAAVGMNPLDAKLRAGAKARPEGPRILGFEGAGLVAAVGAGVRGFMPGDRVAWLGQVDRLGATAQFTAIDHRLAAPVPDALALEEAAAVPMAFVTAEGLLLDRMRLGARDRDTLLIVNGAGGIGSAAIQIARARTGMRVIATASREESRAWCLSLGAHEVIDHRGSIAEALRRAGHRSVAAIASLGHSERNFPDLVRALAPHGILGLIDQPAALDATALRPKAQGLVFEGAFVPALMRPEALARQNAILTQALADVAKGRFRSIRGGAVEVMSRQSLIRAHRALEAGTNIGKQVLKVEEPVAEDRSGGRDIF